MDNKLSNDLEYCDALCSLANRSLLEMRVSIGKIGQDASNDPLYKRNSLILKYQISFWGCFVCASLHPP